MIIVHAYSEVKNDMAQDYIKAAGRCVEATRKENGNHFYSLYTDSANPLKFVVVEEWESKAALDAHMQAPHFAEFRAQTKDLLVAPSDVKIYEARAL